MKRRAVLQSLASVVAVSRRPRGARDVSTAPAQQPFAFDAAAVAALRALADVALPSALDAGAREGIVDDFVRWHRNYREGGETGHSYGASTLGRPTGPPPAAQYRDQFGGLDRAAQAGGAASFAAASVDARRAIVIAVLDAAPGVARLPSRPTGRNLVADFMGFWFNSPVAWDMAYQAEIGRDTCRSLDGSDRAPRRIAPAGSE
jgi:hypothetical protein